MGGNGTFGPGAVIGALSSLPRVLAALITSLVVGAAAPPSAFTCEAVSGAPLQGAPITVRDRFRSQKVRALQIAQICRPAVLGAGRAPSSAVRLSCYAIDPKRALSRSLTVENAFGRQTLALIRSDSVCTPARSGPTAQPLVRAGPATKLFDHLACYAAAPGTFATRRATVSDGVLRRARLTVLRPASLCVSAELRHGRTVFLRRLPSLLLACFAVSPVRTTPTPLLVLDSLGLFEVHVGAPARLCLASTEAVVPPPPPPPRPPPPPPPPPPG